MAQEDSDPLSNFLNQDYESQKEVTPDLKHPTGHVSDYIPRRVIINPKLHAEAQKQFRHDFYSRIKLAEIEIRDPEHFLFISGRNKFLSRDYRHWKKEKTGRFSFMPFVQAHFAQLPDGTYKPDKIEWRPEEPINYVNDSQILNFNGPDSVLNPEEKPRLSGSFGIGSYVSLSFDFEASGHLKKINLVPTNTQEAPLYNFPLANSPLLKGEPVKIPEGDTIFIITPQDKHFLLTRTVNGVIRDEIVLPKVLHYDDVVNDLFNAQTLADPIHAPAGLDHTWRDVNPMDVLGMSWKIHPDKTQPRSSQEIKETINTEIPTDK